MNSAVFARPARTRLPKPALATAAPASPPIRACEELDGIPPNQVIRFQVIAPTRAARITRASTLSGRTMPLPIVWATLTPNPNAATKLKNAAQTTACVGLRTRVETTVAIELAASWNPLMKSKSQGDGDDEDDRGRRAPWRRG